MFSVPATMLRQSLRRCARQASSAASRSPLLQSRLAINVARNDALSSVRSIAPLSRFQYLAVRAYHAEAGAVEDQVPSHLNDGGSSGKITDFKQLQSLDVHPNLLRVISDDFKYDTMTRVQSATIAPALKGKDM